MRDESLGYIKAGKKNEYWWTNRLARISKVWGVQQQDRFAWLYYPCCSKTFFRRVISVVKLAPTTLRCIVAIKKLNNIMINCFWNPRASVLPDKWRFDLSQDWETLVLDFESFSTDDWADETLQALGFHISVTGYLEKRSPRFTNVTDLEMIAELAVMNKPGQVVTDAEEEVVKKKNEHAAKKKERLPKLHALVGSTLSLCPKSSPFLSPRSMPIPVPAPMPAPVTTPISCPGSSTILSSRCVSAPVSRPGSLAVLSSRRCARSCFSFWIPRYFVVLTFTRFSCICSSFLALSCSCFSSQNFSSSVAASYTRSTSSS